MGDLIFIEHLLKENISDRDFVIKTLFHQLVRPKFNQERLQNLSDSELKILGSELIKIENDTFEYYKDSGNFYNDFKQALIISNQKRREEFRQLVGPIIKSAQTSLISFNNEYTKIINQTLIGSSFIQDSIQGLTDIYKHLDNSQLRILESIKPILSQYDSAARIISESLKPQIDLWQKWADQSKGIFDNFSKHWEEFQKKYDVAEAKAASVLQKYKWFITPSMPITFIYKIIQFDKKKGRHDKEINLLFIQYFEENNWKNLEDMVFKWMENPIFIKRKKILLDCLKITKISEINKINAANAVLPTLITQIDGVISDYLSSKGLLWDCEYDDWVNTNTGKVNKIGRKSLLKKSKPTTLTNQLDELANDIFLNILFQKSQKGIPLQTPFNFNRHKIIHGEIKRYGRKDYLVRAFMILDLLAHF
jgi:hypothetical protein